MVKRQNLQAKGLTGVPRKRRLSLRRSGSSIEFLSAARNARHLKSMGPDLVETRDTPDAAARIWQPECRREHAVWRFLHVRTKSPSSLICWTAVIACRIARTFGAWASVVATVHSSADATPCMSRDRATYGSETGWRGRA